MINVDDVVKALTPIIEDNCACCDLPKCTFYIKYFFYLEMFYLNTIEQLFLFVEQLDQFKVCQPKNLL